MSIELDQPLQVGAWQYLPEQDKLVKFDDQGEVNEVAELDNLCQKVINYFIAHAGKLVTKDELLLNVWGIQDVTDGRVTRVIRVLRVALGDDSKEPYYIETIPKRGYRFIAPVVLATTATDIATDLTPAPKQYFSYMAVLVMALLLGGAILYWWAQRADDINNEVSTPMYRYRHITSLDGLEFYHNASADERYLVYSYAKPKSDNSTVLILEDLQQNKRLTITEPLYDSFGAVFNFAANKVAYQRLYPDGRCEIRLIELDNINFQLLTDELLVHCAENTVSARLTWSPDGRYLVYPEMDAQQRQMVLQLLPLDSRTPEQLTAPSASSFGDYAARFSRKGDKLVFLRDASGTTQIWLLDLSSRATQFLVAIKDIYPANVDWNLDDSAIIYPSAATAISRVDTQSLQNQIIAFTDDYASELQVTGSGKILVSAGDFRRINIKKISNPMRNLQPTEQIMFSSNRNETHIEVNPIETGPTAVVSRRSGLPQLWFFYPDGRQNQVTYFSKNKRFRNINFSPDGQKLLMQLSNEIWLLDLEHNLSHLAGKEGDIIGMPSWSKNGQNIYYAESKQGRWQIISRNILDNTAKSVIATDKELYLESAQANYTFWRDSGNKQFYVQREGTAIQQLPIAIPDAQVTLTFFLGTTGIYYAYLNSAMEYQLRFYDFQQQQTRVVLERMQLGRFSLSADENDIYYLEYEFGDIDIAEFTPNIGSLY
jgi:transcriptional activator of cad operon